MGEMVKNAHKILVGNFEGKNNLGDLGLNGRIILIYILRNYGVWVWTRLAAQDMVQWQLL
jgi:hypothetical protein